VEAAEQLLPPPPHLQLLSCTAAALLSTAVPE
jgi:hypothetical protein